MAVGLLPLAVAENPAGEIPGKGLLLDLDADHGVVVEDGDRVGIWTNQVKEAKAAEFVKRDEGRKTKGSGRPELRKAVKELNGHNALVFRQGELVNMEEDVFDGLTTGKGFTWFCVLAVHEQRVGLEDVNSFFGNLRNGEKYEGLWANVRDDNTLWTGGRNGITFGRFDENNPEVVGPVLEKGRFHLVASRMGAGVGAQMIELFVNGTKPVTKAAFPVSAEGNPSRMAVGQERDAIEHPGKESFDGEIARLLIYERPLEDAELEEVMELLKREYGL
ncbi:MAG: hypothetical protein O3A87_02295 [Verrucomicrobia bacterium]|nr:hypothetical protein [Verrucomicrobiota bacterium]MDA1005300.1 hypothetical protein [Verrucomicrobiota bacterium]